MNIRNYIPLMELGTQAIELFPIELKTDENKLHGCTYNVWYKIKSRNPLEVIAISDSKFISGMLKYICDRLDSVDTLDSITIEGTNFRIPVKVKSFFKDLLCEK